MLLRHCNKCGQDKPANEFEPGKRHRCLACRAAYNKQWYDKNSEREKESGRSWHINNRERSRANSKAWKQNNRQRYLKGLKVRSIERRYGISADVFYMTIEAQYNHCPLCRTYYPTDSRAWCVDHDHNTGKVRGVICQNCNFVLGHAKDKVETLARAIGYLEGHKQCSK